MVVGMDVLEEIFAPCRPAVVRDDEHEAEEIDTQRVGRIDPDLAEVEGTRIEFRDARPVLPTITRPEHSAFLATRLVDSDRPTRVTLHNGEEDARLAHID